MKMHLQDLLLGQAYMKHKLAVDGLAWKQINLLLMKILVFVRLCQIDDFRPPVLWSLI